MIEITNINELEKLDRKETIELIEKKDKIINELAIRLWELGRCPFIKYKCEKFCLDNAIDCWIDWADERIKNGA